jgi:limonene-1,2-epoxide hydrolase
MTPASFPAMFAEGWTLPKPDAFLDYFLPLISPDATFRQPVFPDARGPAQIEQMFRRLFVLFPDLTCTVRRSAIAGDVIFIESECTGSLGRTTVRFDVCDRFVIDNGMLADRRAFSDPQPILLAILRRPAAWPRAIRARCRRSWKFPGVDR